MSFVPAALAELRAKLLHAREIATAVEEVIGFLDANVGKTVTVPADSVPDGAREPMFRVPGEPARVVLVTLEDESDAEIVRAVAADLMRASELLQAEEERRALGAALREKDALLQQTTDALFRDAAEIVRVLGELERRDTAIKDELQRALKFQRATIDHLPAHPGFVFDAVYLAADLISADFYDIAVLGSDHIRIFVADATGHGIAAGLATMFIKAEYESLKFVRDTPSALVESMNDMLTSRYERLDLRCTGICIDVHPERGKMVFTSAAHPGPLLVRENGPEQLSGGNTFLGLRAGVPFTPVEVPIAPGDLVIAYTDGLLDAAAPSGATFGRSSIEALATKARQDPSSFGSLVVSGLAEFVGEGRKLSDDVTAVAVALLRSD